MSEATTAHEALAIAEQWLTGRKLERAMHAFDQAELLGAAADQCSAGRWLAAMLRGDFAAAWRESDAIRERDAPDPMRFWQGDDIRGKRVMLRCLHGLGDAVQFLRYAPLLHGLASKLVVEVPPALLELAPCFAGVDEVVTWGEKAPADAPAWDVQMEITELPYAFRTQVDDLPLTTEYLHLPQRVLRETAPHANAPDRVRVGLVWSCGAWNPTRSVPVELLRPLMQTPHCEFWNLQGGPPRAQWAHLGQSTALHDAASSADTVAKLAGLIAQLDLVITPDTLTAHLAGALGTPAWVLLQHAADWRWMHERADSPWYPSLRLFRQPMPGDWRGCICQVEFSLRTVDRELPLVA